jgi:hypothetical protein
LTYISSCNTTKLRLSSSSDATFKSSCNREVLFQKMVLLRFMLLTVMKMSTVVFWVVMLCSLIDDYQCFREMYHLHLQG